MALLLMMMRLKKSITKLSSSVRRNIRKSQRMKGKEGTISIKLIRLLRTRISNSLGRTRPREDLEKLVQETVMRTRELRGKLDVTKLKMMRISRDQNDSRLSLSKI
jgi:hypothetical protein